ncbi:MAG: family 10 glycosylhydrolase, partial [Proteobacteria bacterium]|nr:family 10 glycosylhydrolase [Pseudomonadota bacterium]
ADARALGTTDLLVQVYRGGRAWYDATLADPAPYRQILASVGHDTLEDLIERAHAAGIRVHAWVNVLSLSHNLDAPLVRDLGPGAVHVDRRGRSLLSYPGLEMPAPDGDWYRMGTRGVYLDPAAPGVSERLAATFAELVARYPCLDGLHLDYVRHPDVLPFVPGSRFGVGMDFGYGEGSRLRFQRETGLRAPVEGSMVNTNRWDEWRRQKVTELVARIRSEAQAARPGLLLSAAVASHVDRAYLSLAQDWKGWLEAGLIDVAVPMAYTLDDRLFRYQVESFASGPDADRIWPGLGVWLFAENPEGALEQLEILRAAGAAGEALFSYDSIADAPRLLAALSAGRAPAAASGVDRSVPAPATEGGDGASGS